MWKAVKVERRRHEIKRKRGKREKRKKSGENVEKLNKGKSIELIYDWAISPRIVQKTKISLIEIRW